MEDEEFFFLIEKEKPGAKGDDRKRQRGQDEPAGREGRIKDGEPEALDEIIKRVPQEKRPVFKREDIKRVDDRRRIEKNLEENRHDVLDVADPDMRHRGDEREPPGKKEMEEDNDGDKEEAPGEGRLEDGHEPEKD